VAAAQHDTVVKILQEWHEVVYLSTLFGHHSLQLRLSGDSEYHLWELAHRAHAPLLPLPGWPAGHSYRCSSGPRHRG
jgi:hypothetical protein